MNTFILATHIAFLVLSLLMTTGLVVTSLLRIVPARFLRRINLIMTTVGVSLGALLLIQNPLGAHCIELTAYVAVFSLLYGFTEQRSSRLAKTSLAG